MEIRGSKGLTAVTAVAIAAMLATPGGAAAAWMQVATDRQARPAAAPAQDWPRRYTAPNGAGVVLYEPQVSSWVNQKLLTMYAAVAYTAPGATSSQLGTIVAEADTRVSVAERLVDFSSLRIIQSNFGTATREQATDAVAAIKAAVPFNDRVLSLDRVLAYVDASQITPKNQEGVKADPPAIFYSTRPAIMVNIDGNPVWSPIQGNDLRFAVNTNWDLFEHQPTQTFYLRNDKMWLKAPAVTGPWTVATVVPNSFPKLPSDDNWKDVRAALPARAVAASLVPTVFVSMTPAELIAVNGEPRYVPVTGTQLQWVSNTDSDVFRLGTDGLVYYLVAGRWFSAPGFNGPWTFATPALPADFARIPLEHERSRVLASVPGTSQAAEAVLLASVPQTARVSKKMVQAPDVAYQGEPQWEQIQPTTVSRAINTDKDIFKVGDLYYMCFQGVWFVSRSAEGPWEVTGSVPSQIYEIPISSSSHHVTYVTVEDDDDEWVVFATAAAYTGVMVAWGCAVWGSGWYYPPYIWGGAYYPRFPTYGYSAWYNPWSGAYGRGVGVYGPYGGAGIGARYNPRTGTYARGAAAYGPYGARGVASAYNPRTGAYASTRQGSNVYGSWGATGVHRGDQWAQTARVTNNRTDTTTRATRTSGGGGAVTRNTPGPGGGAIGTTGSGDVYAGRDGNVYRREGDSWQKYDNGSWSGVDRQSSQAGQLNRDAGARSSGAERQRSAEVGQSISNTPINRNTGTYRPSPGTTRSGGVSRGGGGVSRGGGRRR